MFLAERLIQLRKQLRVQTVQALYDRQLLLIVTVLLAAGLIMVSSASIATTEKVHVLSSSLALMQRQFIFLSMSLCACIVVLQIPVRIWEKYNVFLLLATLVLLIMVLFVGKNVNGSVRWINLGLINFQPSELSKLALLTYIPGYLTRKHQEVRESLRGFLKPLVVFFALALLLLAQPDLGSVIVMFVTVIGVLFIAGARLSQFLGLVVVGIAAVITLILVSPYRVQRLVAFMDPWADPFGSGYQLTQSLMALGRGGWLGQGLGNSVQKLEYLPEAHTDFIFAIIGEELGFIGATVVLLAQLFLAIKALHIGWRVLHKQQYYGGYLACGVGIWFAFQTAVNVGAVSGLIPTKGLTLPLVSYGGSSLVVMMIAIGLLFRVDHELRIRCIQARKK